MSSTMLCVLVYIYTFFNYYEQRSPLMRVLLFSLRLIVILGSLTRNLNPAYYSTSCSRHLKVHESVLTHIDCADDTTYNSIF